MNKAPYYTLTWLSGYKALGQLRVGDEQEANELAWRLRTMSWFTDPKPDKIKVARVNNGDSDLLDVIPLT